MNLAAVVRQTLYVKLLSFIIVMKVKLVMFTVHIRRTAFFCNYYACTIESRLYEVLRLLPGAVQYSSDTVVSWKIPPADVSSSSS